MGDFIFFYSSAIVYLLVYLAIKGIDDMTDNFLETILVIMFLPVFMVIFIIHIMIKGVKYLKNRPHDKKR